jgi:phage gp45-like
MHRATPLNTSFRAYTSGGSRSAVHEVDDGKKMQTSKSNGMKNETRDNIESPQNYGFTSVIADADKGQNGSLKNSAEAVMNFMGGNRSFPMTTSMDDRRHRLWNLGKDAAKGAAAMFGLKEWGQQYLNTEDGQFITGNMKKKNRMQLVENKNGQKQQQDPNTGAVTNPQGTFRNAHGRLAVRSKSGVEFEFEELHPDDILKIGTFAEGGGSNGGSGGDSGGGGAQQGKNSATGQKTLHKEESTVYVEQNGTDTKSVHGEAYATQKTGSDSSTHWEKDKVKSTQCTDLHVHIRFKEFRIFNDKEGNWATSPIGIKMDKYCKEG